LFLADEQVDVADRDLLATRNHEAGERVDPLAHVAGAAYAKMRL
jgi:hypothetical protein